MAVFSLAAMFLGVLAAIKMSEIISVYLQENTTWNLKAIPIIAFIIMLVTVALIVTLVGKAIEAAVGFTLLGPANKMAGAALYLVLYAFLMSILLQFAFQTGWITLDDSWLTTKLAAFAPFIFEIIGKQIPLFSFFPYFESN